MAGYPGRWFYPALVALACVFAVALHVWRPLTPGVECGFAMALTLTASGARDRAQVRFLEWSGDVVGAMNRQVDAMEQYGVARETIERMRFEVLELSHALPAKKAKP